MTKQCVNGKGEWLLLADFSRFSVDIEILFASQALHLCRRMSAGDNENSGAEGVFSPVGMWGFGNPLSQTVSPLSCATNSASMSAASDCEVT